MYIHTYMHTYTILILIYVKNTSTINLFGFETSKLKFED